MPKKEETRRKMEPEKLFTLNDVAMLTSLTTRTLRNHLKDGTLRGSKVGGQWRFRMADIENFTLNSPKKQPEIKGNEASVIEYMEERSKTGRQVCSIIDLEVDEQRALAKEFILKDLVNRFDAKNMSYTYEYKTGFARFIIIASPELTISALDLLS